MSKEVVLLGATGSIGRSTLDVIAALDGAFRVAAVTAHSRWEELAAIVRRFRPRLAVIGDDASAVLLRQALKGIDVEIRSGAEGLKYAAALEGADIVVTGIVGGSGLEATLEAVRCCRRVGVANKEPFVMAGRLIATLARESGCEIVPIDSEHSAVFQCLQGEPVEAIHRIYLTGSGGPFRTRPAEEFDRVTPAEALNHPTWDMGPKITIDSATMMNKALELVEARWLFNAAPEQLEVVIHPQSIVHSMVAFVDGSIKAQLGFPDMRVPIQYALTYPERAFSERDQLNLAAIAALTFETPDLDKYPALRLGYEALRRKGDTWGPIMNAANEEAVTLFLNEQIRFTQITQLIEQALDEFAGEETCTLARILEIDRDVRTFTHRIGGQSA